VLLRKLPWLDKAVSTIRRKPKQVAAVVMAVTGLVLIPLGVALALGAAFGLTVGGGLALAGGLLLDRSVE